MKLGSYLLQFDVVIEAEAPADMPHEDFIHGVRMELASTLDAGGLEAGTIYVASRYALRREVYMQTLQDLYYTGRLPHVPLSAFPSTRK